MFTGLVEELGTVRNIARQQEAMKLTIAAKKVLEDVQIGDSICVNGVCLTVVTYDQTTMTVEVVPETYRRSTLKFLAQGDRVNLERAMPANGRFGGHIVQGHVDAMGIVTARTPEHNAVIFQIRPENPHILRYVVPKGSITIDGISLTVVDVNESAFTVSIIPHTLTETTLAERKPGHYVNLETDIIGKYVEKLLSGHTSQTRGISMQFLSEHGFI